jgi:hypothetical protein
MSKIDIFGEFPRFSRRCRNRPSTPSANSQGFPEDVEIPPLQGRIDIFGVAINIFGFLPAWQLYHPPAGHAALEGPNAQLLPRLPDRVFSKPRRLAARVQVA